MFFSAIYHYARNIPALLCHQKLHAKIKYNLNQHAVLATIFRLDKELKLFGW